MKKWFLSIAFVCFCVCAQATECDFIIHAKSGNLSATTLTLEYPDSMIMVVEKNCKAPKFMEISEFVENWNLSKPNAALNFVFKDDVRTVIVALDKPTYEKGVLVFPASQIGKPQTGDFINSSLYVEHIVTSSN